MAANVVPVQGDEPRGAIKYRGAGRWFLNSTARRLVGAGVTHFRVSYDADERFVVIEPVKDEKIGRRASQSAGLVKYHGQGFSHQQLCDLVEQQFKSSASELRFVIVGEDSSSDRLVFEVFKTAQFETVPYPEKPGEFEISLRNRNGHGFEFSFADARGLIAIVEVMFRFIPPVLAHEEDREDAVDQAIENMVFAIRDAEAE